MTSGGEVKARPAFTPWALGFLAVILVGLGSWAGSKVIEADTRSQINESKYDTLAKDMAELKKMVREILHNQTEMKIQLRGGR